MYTPILFDLELIKIAKIMYTPILFDLNFNISRGYTLCSFCACATLSRAQNYMIYTC